MLVQEDLSGSFIRIRNSRIHSDHLHSGELEAPGAAKYEKLEAVEQQGSKMQRKSKVEHLGTPCRVVGKSLHWRMKKWKTHAHR